MLRFFVVTGIVGGLVVAYLTTFGVGKITQLPPSESLLTEFRAEGAVPKNVNLALDETAEDLDVFTVPAADKTHLEAAEAAYSKMSSGMDMSGSSGSTMTASDGSTMNMPSTKATGMNSGATGTSMTASDGSTTTMPSTNATGMNNGATGTSMTASDGSTMTMPSTNTTGTSMAAKAQMPMGEAGLAFAKDGAFDREITLTMQEWKFSQMKIDVKPGERIKFTVKNGGQIPHEFMFMSPPLMNAVKYRSTRADWNLFEHEALYERALVLPGGEFTFVMQVQTPGAWMFMCMLPYHMQMGMMGQMATKGMAMDM